MEEASSAANPLLRSPSGAGDRPSPRRAASLAVLLGRATGRRGPSMLVRETAALQLEERRADWGYSKPVVLLDVLWNLAFAAVSVAMLASTAAERPRVPIRVWIGGYALQCLVHVALVWAEYRRRCSRRRGRGLEGGRDGSGRESDSELNDSEDEGGDEGFGLGGQSRCCVFLIKVFSCYIHTRHLLI